MRPHLTTTPPVRFVPLPGARSGQPYTPEDDETIRRMYPDTDALTIAARLGRNVEVIRKRAQLLGVKCSPERRRAISRRFNGSHPEWKPAQ